MAIDVTLRRQERNDVLNLIKRYNFDPAEFDWNEVEQVETMGRIQRRFKVNGLTHRQTGFYITFGGVRTQFSPGPNVRAEAHENLGQGSWAFKQSYCQQWLAELRKELDVPDLWATVGQERVLSNAASSTSDNHPFTLVEQSLIVAELDKLKEYVRAGQEFQAEQAEFIEKQFDYLREASIRLGRKDWLNTALGVFVGLIVNLALEPERARGLLGIAGTLFKWVWTAAHGLLQQ